MDLIEQDGMRKQRVGPGDVRPETQVILRGEEGACGGTTVMYLVNRPAELAQLLRSLPHVASSSGEEGAALEAREELERIAGELERLPENGSADRTRTLLNELSSRLIVTERETAGGVDSAAWGAAGTLREYLADEKSAGQFYGMLALFCTDEAVRQSGEEINWCRDALPRLQSERRFRLPGDETLIAQAVNLFNRGLGESCGGW
jgi:hypothetical protein